MTKATDNVGKSVLLAMLGESPGVLTETVWALGKEGRMLDALSVMTTTKGAEIFRREVMETGQWHELGERLRQQGAKRRLPVPRLSVFRNEMGRELMDVESTEDVETAGNELLRWVRGYAADPSVRVTASISGGRKTMTMLLSTCMSLLGREKDRMVHVHVPPPFDRRLDPVFLFPGSSPEYRTPQGERISGEDVPVTLIDVPFVPLSDIYQKYWGNAPGGFTEMVGRLRRVGVGAEPGIAYDPEERVLRTTKGSLTVSEAEGACLNYLWTLEDPRQGWAGDEDLRKAAGRVRSRLKQQGWTPTDIELWIPNFRKTPNPRPWPPPGVRTP